MAVNSLGNFLLMYQRAFGCISSIKFYSLKVKINMRIQQHFIYLIVIPAQTTPELCYSLSFHLDSPCYVCLLWDRQGEQVLH